MPHQLQRLLQDRRVRALVPLLLSVALLAPAAAVQAPHLADAAARSFGKKIEWFAAQQPQKTCSPTPKPGTLKLATWLQKTYKGTGSLGISRACKAGARSEHKEGRAFDWKVNVRNSKQKAQAAAFLKYLLATDRYGNKAAMARRMGVMYVIWNRRIWSTSSPTVWRPYHGASAHTDHMHISLGWNGALGKTSFWSGLVVDPVLPPVKPPVKVAPTPAPVPTAKPTPPPVPTVKPTPAPVVPVAPPAWTPRPTPTPTPTPTPAPIWPPLVDLSTGSPVDVEVPVLGQVTTTPFSLKAGTKYRLAVSGTYRYGTGSSLADATCNWHPYDDKGWARQSTWESTGTAQFDLVVDGRSDWRTRSGSTGSCDSAHVYYLDHTPSASGPLTLQVLDDYYPDNSGSLRLSVMKAGASVWDLASPVPPAAALPEDDEPRLTDGPAAYVDSVDVPADGGVVRTRQVLEAGISYTVTASGVIDFGEGESDAACLRRGQSTSWKRTASVDPLHQEQASLDLYVDGVAPGFSPVGTATSNCATSTHTYTWTYTPSIDGRARLQVFDPSPQDNTGALRVTVERSTAVAPPSPDGSAVTGGPTLVDETVTLPADSASPVRTAGSLVRGATYQVTVSGAYDTGYGLADAECAARGGEWDSEVDWNTVRPADLFDLYLNGVDPALTAADADAAGCSELHVWKGSYTATRNGALRLGIWDVDLGDNSGELTVRVTRVVAGQTPPPATSPSPSPPRTA
ncbi:hypothetical protein [Motilibacter deserti]|uniref:ARB-07466-like C-terminal domain-containing protein n=1 Tax=Motilibacter deserti TaxID=2714956 RepID=A0ABX0GSN5_9ACTN|nr:hypothetical protein [Motilibacter deserti]NHC12689.1 hypothetical protein [Motilibacter deserti]